FYGPPGCGKTMLSMRFSSILPDPTRGETWEIEQIRDEALITGSLTSIPSMYSGRPFQ
ncbi:MAG: ATP-binding protein, partial [Actinomycetota bacterium]